MTKAEKETAMKAATVINEDPFWAKLCDYNAVAVISATCFIIGFYA